MEKKKLLIRLDVEAVEALESLTQSSGLSMTAIVNDLIIKAGSKTNKETDIRSAVAAARAAESAANISVGILNSMMWAMASMTDGKYRDDPHSIIAGAALAEKNRRFDKMKGDPV